MGWIDKICEDYFCGVRRTTAGGLSPGKEDSAAPRKKDRKDIVSFISV